MTRALLDAGHRAVGLCNVAITFQRLFARLLGVEPERIVVDQVGLNHLTWVRAVRVDGDGRAARAARGPRRGARRRRSELPRRLLRRARRDPLLLPALLLRDTTRCSPSSSAGVRAPRPWPRSSASCSTCTATRRSTRSRRCSSSAAARSTARRRRDWSRVARSARTTGDVHDRRRPQRGHDRRTRRRRRGRGAGAGRRRRAPTPLPHRRRSRPSCSASSSTWRPTSGSPLRRRSAATAPRRARRCSLIR